LIPAEFWEHGTIRPEALLKLPGPFLVSEVALALRCSSDYIYKCIKAGTIKAGRIGSEYRIPAQEARKLYDGAFPTG
jgi:excisionase family DNA binding protein